MTGQLRKHSIIESCASTGTGFCISLAATFLIYPAFGVRTTPEQNLWTTLAFTVISIIRQYFWRRVFNWWQHRSQL